MFYFKITKYNLYRKSGLTSIVLKLSRESGIMYHNSQVKYSHSLFLYHTQANNDFYNFNGLQEKNKERNIQ